MKIVRLAASSRKQNNVFTALAVSFLISACLLTANSFASAEEVAQDVVRAEVSAGTNKQSVQINASNSTNDKTQPQAERQAASNVAKGDIPKAESIDLQKPVISEKLKKTKTVAAAPEPLVGERSAESHKQATKAKVAIESGKVASGKQNQREKKKAQAKPGAGIPFILLGAEVPAGTSTRLSWSPSETFEGIANPTPVLVINGKKPGPVLCLTAAVHGDELNGIEIVRRMLYNIDPGKLSGAVIGVPIVNLQGFRRTSRYLADRRDLNRFFPGNPDGSSASRIAYSFFNEVISHCSALVDLHTGSFYRTNLPQLRANLKNADVLGLTHGFGATVVLHSDAAVGTLRRAAVDVGIPAVTLEAGEPMRVQEKEVEHGVKGIQTLLHHLKMYKKPGMWGEPEPVYYQSEWVRADQGGILFTRVHLGKRIRKGDLLGTITDPITNVRANVTSPHNGRVLGMALNQVVMPGFAAFRIGIQKSEDELAEPASELSTTGDDSSKIQATPAQKTIARSNIDQSNGEDSE